jgi:hypothetical protein
MENEEISKIKDFGTLTISKIEEIPNKIKESVKIPPINKPKKIKFAPNKDIITIKRISVQNIPRTEKKLIDYYEKIIDWNNNNPSSHVKPPRLFIDDFNYYASLIDEAYKNPLHTEDKITDKMKIVREDPMK